MTKRVPDVRLDLYLAPSGYKAIAFVDNEEYITYHGDYAREYEYQNDHVDAVLVEIDGMLNALRARRSSARREPLYYVWYDGKWCKVVEENDSEVRIETPFAFSDGSIHHNLYLWVSREDVACLDARSSPYTLACVCGKCGDDSERWFICDSCKRPTPWCRGAADEYSDLCDECAVKAGVCDEDSN